MGAGGALLVVLMRRFGRRWWAPAAARRGRLRRAHDLRGPDRARPAVQQVQAAAGRRAARGRARAGRAGRREGRRGVRDGRVAPHDRRQRLRHRPRLDQARRALRHAAATTSRPTRCGSSSPTSSGTCTTDDVPRGLLYLALVAPVGMFAVARLSRAAGAGGAGPARRAGASALALALIVPGDHDRLQPALARGRGARRPLLDASSPRDPEALIELPEADRGPERLRPRPAGLGRASCSARTRRRWSGSARRWPSSALAPGGSRRRSLGEVLDPLLGLPLGLVVLHRVDQLAHEPRRHADARDDHAGDLLVLDLVVHARERDRELVVRVARRSRSSRTSPPSPRARCGC